MLKGLKSAVAEWGEVEDMAQRVLSSHVNISQRCVCAVLIPDLILSSASCTSSLTPPHTPMPTPLPLADDE